MQFIRNAALARECQCTRIVPPISKSSNTFIHIIFSEDLGRKDVFIESDETTNEGGGRRTHLSSRNLPSTERNVGNLTSAENQELDGGRADGRKGDRGTTSGNLRGIEDLVHSYPPTSRPRPAESSLGLNAPIPFS